MARELPYRLFDPFHHHYLHDVYNGDPSEILVFNEKTHVYNLKPTATVDEGSVVFQVSGLVNRPKSDGAAYGIWFSENNVDLGSNCS